MGFEARASDPASLSRRTTGPHSRLAERIQKNWLATVWLIRLSEPIITQLGLATGDCAINSLLRNVASDRPSPRACGTLLGPERARANSPDAPGHILVSENHCRYREEPYYDGCTQRIISGTCSYPGSLILMSAPSVKPSQISARILSLICSGVNGFFK
jgi:hypothetical protein